MGDVGGISSTRPKCMSPAFTIGTPSGMAYTEASTRVAKVPRFQSTWFKVSRTQLNSGRLPNPEAIARISTLCVANWAEGEATRSRNRQAIEGFQLERTGARFEIAQSAIAGSCVPDEKRSFSVEQTAKDNHLSDAMLLGDSKFSKLLRSWGLWVSLGDFRRFLYEATVKSMPKAKPLRR